MRSRLPLLSLSLYRRRRLLVMLAVGLCLFELLIVTVAIAIPPEELMSGSGKSSESFDAFSGSSGAVKLASVVGLLGAGMIHPFWLALQLSAVISLGAAIFATDVDDGTIELILVRPISRLRLLAERFAAVLIAAAGLCLASGLPLLGALGISDAIGQATSAQSIFQALVSGFALLFCFAGITAAISCSVRLRSRVITLVSGLAAAAYALNFLGDIWSPLHFLTLLSPLHYYRPGDALAGQGVALSACLPLIATGLAGLGVAARVVRRRNI